MSICYSVKTRAFYDLDLNYRDLPDDLIPVSPEEHRHFLHEMNSNGRELAVVGGELTLVDAKPADVSWDEIRAHRNKLLADSDWTQMPDWEGPSKSLWKAYRQYLRDVPQQFARTPEIVWPEAPE